MRCKDNAQAVVNANPFDPCVERTSAGTISIVNVAFINADAIDVRGVDIAGSYDPRSADARGRRVFIRFETGCRRI